VQAVSRDESRGVVTMGRKKGVPRPDFKAMQSSMAGGGAPEAR
jgi:hypothetical protein